MTAFSSRNQSTANVPASQEAIWAVLSDPDALARLTPLVRGITAEGDLWCWQLSGISALGISVEPAFTERMTFTDGSCIRFRPDPPFGDQQRAGATGRYELSERDGGVTHLAIDITIDVDLPLPKLSAKAVERVMATAMARTGDRFARNLYEQLDLDPTTATTNS